MSGAGRIVGLVLTAAMFAFSCFMFLNTGDWVAAVFAIGSLAYGIFFLTTSASRGGSS